MPAPNSHWSAHARQWSWIGPPLRPAPEDLAVLDEVLRSFPGPAGRPLERAVLLGVTPEIVSLPWPAGAHLVAVDQSLAMIRAVWSGAARGFAALCASWQRLPLRPGSQDLVLGDGCFTSFASRAPYELALGSVRRVLRGDGLFVMRFFVRPEKREPVAAVMEDLRAARIGSFHAFKWRLAMALHGTFEEGVRLGDVWQAWREGVPDGDSLAARLGWPLPAVRTIDAYRGIGARYTFPTLDEVRALLQPSFEELACRIPRYEIGACCPTLVMRLRPGGSAP